MPVTPSAPARILIVRLSALGDLVFCTSLLDGLRRAFPDAHIAWLAQSGFAGVLRDDPRLDELITISKDTLKSPAALWRLRRELRARRFDWVIDAQGLAKSRVLAWLAGGTRRVGFRSKEPLAFLLHEQFDKGGDPADIASEYRYLAERLTGAPAAAPRLPVAAAAAARVAEAMAARRLASGFLALCPFTTRPQKHWPDEHWPALARRLVTTGLGPCVVFGGPADREHAQRLVAQMPAGSLNLAGQTALPDLAAWLSQARAVVGVDTGLTHIGIAVHTPTIALFGSTCPYTQGAESPLRVIYDGLPCAPCKRRPTCNGAFTCMRQLTPERVADAVTDLLGRVR
ncbi:lipopolysaccharide heptosyltransferase II [Fontimonas sp. SYSU GA230001]|uniref:lipopolysaccharide heptosyltransferase II n=1 Tax=Fontimonas sp. SYSU GA230001 TaxID=3142450 RepID=UPI0032B34D28